MRNLLKFPRTRTASKHRRPSGRRGLTVVDLEATSLLEKLTRLRAAQPEAASVIERWVDQALADWSLS